MRTLAVWMCLLAGCGSSAVSLAKGNRTFTPADYPQAYEQWTRHADEFSFGALNDVLNASATFLSWEFRWAYVVRYANDHGYSTEDRQKLLQSSLAESEREHRFYVTLAGTQFRESDLTSDRSAWRVMLIDRLGRGTPPLRMEKIRSPSAAEKRYFPSVSPFRQTFRVSFPRERKDGSQVIAPDAREVVLRFAGSSGIVDLRWKLADTASLASR